MTVSPPILLLIDDDHSVRTALCRLLARYFTVITASSAEDALGVLKTPVPVDLLLSDIMMPGMGAAGLLARLPNALRRRTVLMTASVGRSDVAALIEQHRCPLVRKPFMLNELLEALNLCLALPEESGVAVHAHA